jgi:hypothetical protein
MPCPMTGKKRCGKLAVNMVLPPVVPEGIDVFTATRKLPS